MTASNRMDQGGFERLLDAYGARLDRWPEELRAPAEEWMQHSEPARLAWERAARFDQLLALAPDVEPSASLVARIAAIPIHAPAQSASTAWPFGAAWAALLGWGVAAVLGIWVGGVAAPMLEAIDGADDNAGQESAAEDDAARDEFGDLSELAFGAGLADEEE